MRSIFNFDKLELRDSPAERLHAIVSDPQQLHDRLSGKISFESETVLLHQQQRLRVDYAKATEDLLEADGLLWDGMGFRDAIVSEGQQSFDSRFAAINKQWQNEVQPIGPESIQECDECTAAIKQLAWELLAELDEEKINNYLQSR